MVHLEIRKTNRLYQMTFKIFIKKQKLYSLLFSSQILRTLFSLSLGGDKGGP